MAKGTAVKDFMKVATLAATGLAVLGAYPLWVHETTRNETITVQDKARVTDNNNTIGKHGGTVKSQYLIYTDKGTFKDTDSWLKWKWNSADVYGDLQIGKKYSCEVYGWRSGFLSMYPNIVSCKPAQ